MMRKNKAFGVGAVTLLTALIGVGVAAFANAQPPAAGDGPLAAMLDPKEKHLTNVRQLTFGGQNAEAYWSYDGKKLIFQRYDGDTYKADQQFVMNADGSNRIRVSSGTGRTTCGYFLKGDKQVIFASTHGFGPEIPQDPDRSLGYVWPIFPSYAIWKANADGTNLTPLFPRKVELGKKVGYNAEATVSPDGKRIVFTSTMDGDLELYTMKPDGTDVKRITNRVGYDGGAFFSPDSKKLVWRAGLPKTPEAIADYKRLLEQDLVRPSQMELWMANADGTDAKQITSNGAANFAPYFTPDGNRLVFASNMGDPKRRTFDLYLINLDGSGLEQVTYGRQFDSFPMFSPDGKKLVWGSNRNGKDHETNVFVADWKP
jgi:Tol biopolymer transport system component